MTGEEISKKITKAVDYLGTLKVEGYKNAKILVESLEFLDSLSQQVLLEDSSKPIEAINEEVSHDNTDQ